ncbi:hypothetical protein COO60DRAFT_1108186 [Scenedesmus sp. NREL 46B-D3]|nr:hypothetical protein COO60DRAFT_1108186 [Scenedesmus sp. NREL 46B-D3]
MVLLLLAIVLQFKLCRIPNQQHSRHIMQPRKTAHPGAPQQLQLAYSLAKMRYSQATPCYIYTTHLFAVMAGQHGLLSLKDTRCCQLACEPTTCCPVTCACDTQTPAGTAAPTTHNLMLHAHTHTRNHHRVAHCTAQHSGDTLLQLRSALGLCHRHAKQQCKARRQQASYNQPDAELHAAHSSNTAVPVVQPRACNTVRQRNRVRQAFRTGRSSVARPTEPCLRLASTAACSLSCGTNGTPCMHGATTDTTHLKQQSRQ